MPLQGGPSLTPASPAIARTTDQAARLLPPVVDAMPYAVAVAVGPEGLIHAANAAWTRMAGAANPRLVPGAAFRQFFPSAAAAPIAVLKGDGAVVSQRGVPRAVQPGEAPTWWDLDLVPHPEEPDAVLITARDVTADMLARQAAAPRPLVERRQRRPDVMSLAGDVVLVVRPSDGAILEANDAATAVYGYSRDELTDMRIHDLRAPETVGAVDAQLSESRTHGFLFETLHRRRDGTVFPVEVSAIGADFRGDPITVSVVRDVTARHQAEVALAESETRLRRMVDALPMAAWLQRPDGTAEFCNRRFTDYFGAETQGAAIAGCIDQIHTEDRPRAQAAWRQAIETGGTCEIEARAQRTDKVWRWHRFRIVPVAHEEDGLLEFSVGTAVDIHDVRTAAEQIAARERLLTAAQEAASVGVFECDLRTERATWSPTMFRLYGLDPAAYAHDPTMSHADYLAFLDPRDLDQHLPAWRARAHSGEPRFSFEFRIRRADTGALRWIASRGEIERDASGRPVRAIGVNFDVTEARDATAALQRSEARLRRATEAGRLATFEVDNPGAGEDARVSDGFRFLWGLPEDASCNFETILGRIHPDDRDRVVADHVRLAGEGGRYESEFRVVLPDGTIRWLFSSGEADRGDGGMPRNLRGVNLDITDRKSAEAAVAESEARLRRLTEATREGVCVHAFGRIIDVNRSFAEMFGYAPADLPGRDVFDLIHPDHRESARTQALAGHDQPYESVGQRRDGSIFPVEFRGQTRTWGGERLRFVNVRDLTEVKAARRADLLVRAFTDRANDLLALVDVETARFIYVNETAADTFGHTVEHALTLGVADVDPGWNEARFRDLVAALERGETVPSFESTLRRKDGSVFPVEIKVALIEHEGRRVMGAVLRDITARQQAKAAMAESEAHMRFALSAAQAGAWGYEPVTDTVTWSTENFPLFGLDPAGDPPGYTTWLERCIHPDDRSSLDHQFRSVLAPGGPSDFTMQFRILHPTRGIRWISAPGRVDRVHPDGPAIRIVGLNLDVTERVEAENAQAESEQRLRAAQAASGIGIHDYNILTGEIFWDARVRALWGVPEDQTVTYALFTSGIDPDDLPMVEAAVQRALDPTGAGVYNAEFRVIDRRLGQRRRVAATGQAMFRGGRPARLVGTVRDVTAERAAEAALAESEARLRLAMSTAALGIVEWNLEAGVMRVDAGTEAITRGLLPADRPLALDGPERSRWRALMHPDDLRRREELRRVVEWGQAAAVHDEFRIRLPGAEESWSWIATRTTVVARDKQTGRASRVLDVFQDITPRRRAETALADSEARFRTLAEAVPQIVWTADAAGRLDWHSPRWAEYTGLPAGNGQDGGLDWRPAIHPDDLAQTTQAWTEAVETETRYEVEHRIHGADGTWRWFLSRAVPLRDGPHGPVLRWFGTATDIHDRRMLEEELRRLNQDLEARVAERTRALSDAARELATEMRRREEAQTALLQSQKLEALGQLTGGIAHDFNNILAAIRGGYELLERRIDEPKALNLIRHGQHAAERATRLIAQLMAFARREELRPRLIDPALALRGAEDMICHTAGPRVRCDFEIAAEVWPVIVDTVRLETVLLNLAANARDAMPDGGRLTVALRNAAPAEVPPGLPPGRDHVLISVADTGTGMDAETLRRATEPFFTTKPAGKGTGLGLASAHGFAQQSDGALRLTSAPGEGTAVTLFLPRAGVLPARHETDDLGSDEAALLDAARHGDATVLVVDDDEGVRLVTAGFLRDLGYSVIEAPNAEVAVALAHGDEPIDLLVTDVMMPGVPGPVLAARLRTERPNLPVLYITAHAGGAALGNDPMLGKPFTDAVLARAVLAGLGRLRPAAQGDITADTDRLGARLRGEALRSAYGRWRAQRIQRSGALPPIDAFERALPDNIDEALFIVEVQATPGSGFRMMRIGRALQAQLGRTSKDSLTPDSMFHEPGHMLGGSIGAAYRRCVESRGPVYDYARFAFGDGRPMLFERLVLPLSEDGGVTVTHMAGVALFTEVAIGDTAGSGSAR